MMITFFGILQSIFCFASGSTIRWECFNKYLGCTLKGHSDTRWSSKRQAITSIEKNIKGLYPDLKEMTNNHEWNKETVFGASSIIKNIDFKFICLLYLWSEILISVDCTSLKAKDTFLDIASKLLNGLSKKIKKRRDDGVDDIISKTVSTCDEIGIESSFPNKRTKRVKALPSELARDESCLIPQRQEFQRECFCVYDKLITEMSKR